MAPIEKSASGIKLFDLVLALKDISSDDFCEEHPSPCLLQVPVEGAFPELQSGGDKATAALGNAASTLHMSIKDLGSLKRSKEVGRALVHLLPEKSDAISLGRGDDCDLILLATGVSRKHAELHNQLGNWLLTDLASHNGTFINGKRLDANTPTKVEERHNIWLGSYRAIFLFPEQLYNLAGNLRKKL
jgi:hypothetical protein